MPGGLHTLERVYPMTRKTGRFAHDSVNPPANEPAPRGARGASLLLAACLFAPSASPAAAPEDPPGMFVAIGNHHLHVNCMGVGSPAVVFESGLGGTSLEWIKVQSEVARFTRACSYDRAGYGWSEAGPVPRSGRHLVDELGQLLVNASIAPPYVLVGHSVGGVLVRRYARGNPRRVAGLVLVDSSHEEQFTRMEAAGVKMAAVPRGRRFIVANYWSVPAGLPAEMHTLAQMLAVRPAAVQTLYDELAELRTTVEQHAAGGDLPDVPVTVIARGGPPAGQTLSPRSRQMAELWSQMQRDLAAQSRQGELLTAEGSGHHIQLDRPEMVIGAVRAMVERVRRGRSPRHPWAGVASPMPSAARPPRGSVASRHGVRDRPRVDIQDPAR